MTKPATCITCGSAFAERRAALGYKTCLKCGDGAAKAERSGWTVAPVHKSNYVLITNREELSGINNKTVR